jgi:hypothetical protein
MLQIIHSFHLYSREYDDLDLEAREPLNIGQIIRSARKGIRGAREVFGRELGDDLDIEAREPLRFGGALRGIGRGIGRGVRGGIQSGLFGREFDSDTDIEARAVRKVQGNSYRRQERVACTLHNAQLICR